MFQSRSWLVALIVLGAACDKASTKRPDSAAAADSIAKADSVRADSMGLADPDSLHRAKFSSWNLIPSPNVVALMLKYKDPKVTAAQVRRFAQVELNHDGQKLQLSKGSKDLGPAVKIYSTPTEFDDSKRDVWQHVAYLEVAKFDAGITPTAYTDLGIAYNTSAAVTYCVHLKLDSGTGNFSGAVTPESSGSCGDPASATALLVGVENTSTYADPTQYPAVARFNDDEDDQPTMGVKCGAIHWCEIGQTSGKRRKPYNENWHAAKSAQEAIKSWHDDQELTVWNSAAQKFKRGIRASIVPEPGIGSLKKTDYGSGPVVARIYMEKKGPSGTKYGNWGLARGENEMHLWYTVTSSGPRWSATFNPVGKPGNGIWFHVEPSLHDQPPSIVRWRWDATDEDIWIACDQGCCIVSDGFSLVNEAMKATKARTAASTAKKTP